MRFHRNQYKERKPSALFMQTPVHWTPTFKQFNTHNKASESNVEASITRGGVEGVVDVIRDVQGEQPVIRAVPEQVAQRHCAVGEAVDEQCL